MDEVRTAGGEPVVHLMLAGLGNSSEGHWQREWLTLLPHATWLEHDSWDEPDEQAWLDDLERCLASGTAPVVVVAHSLGCSLLSSWASRLPEGASTRVVAALVVAPPDTERDEFPDEVTGFRSVDHQPLPFPTTVVFSTDDPYAAPERGEAIGRALGARLVEAGALGHINSSSGLGAWPFGLEQLSELEQRAGLDAPPAPGAGIWTRTVPGTA